MFNTSSWLANIYSFLFNATHYGVMVAFWSRSNGHSIFAASQPLRTTSFTTIECHVLVCTTFNLFAFLYVSSLECTISSSTCAQLGISRSNSGLVPGNISYDGRSNPLHVIVCNRCCEIWIVCDRENEHSSSFQSHPRLNTWSRPNFSSLVANYRGLITYR